MHCKGIDCRKKTGESLPGTGRTLHRTGLGCFNHQNQCSVQVKQKFPKLFSFVFQVAQYLLDLSFVLDEESMYEASLRIEPKVPN